MKNTIIKVLPVSVGILLGFFGIGIFPLHADTLGESRAFFVNTSYDATARSSLTATLLVVSEHANYYVDHAYWTGLSEGQKARAQTALQEIAQEFENRIYPTETLFWGKESNPGIDGNTKITILFEKLRNQAGGYFDTVHAYKASSTYASNVREMFFVNAEAIGGPALKTFVAHEFQHLISWNQKENLKKVSEEVWLNEIRSEYTGTLLGYDIPYDRSTLQARVRAFLTNPSDSVTEWPNVASDYAVASLFGQYLVSRFGQEILSETISYSSIGIPSLNEYFARHAIPENFSDVFRDWMIATVLNSTSRDVRFGYTQPNLATFHVSPPVRESMDSSSRYVISQPLKDWQPTWYSFIFPNGEDDRSQGIRFNISNEAGVFYRVSYIIFYRDNSFDVEDVPSLGGVSTTVLVVVPPELASIGIREVLLVATRSHKTEDFGSNEPASSFSVDASLVSRDASIERLGEDSNISFNRRAGFLQDGSFIKRVGVESEEYILRGNYKRYIAPRVQKFYPTIALQGAVSVGDSIFNRYIISNYVRGARDTKVYALWPDGTKHWMHMTGAYFAQSGRDWNAVFVVDDAEIAAYTTGPDITR